MTPDQIMAYAQAWNGALSAAGWNTGLGSGNVRLPRCETNEGRYEPLQRKAQIGENPIYFTPASRCMVFCNLWLDPLKEQETRPWRIHVGEQIATDKRGRVRKWGTSQAALAEARRIERDALGVPRQKRVGTKAKAVTPPRPFALFDGDVT